MDVKTFHGVIGDMDPIEHDGGVVYDRGHGTEMIYFRGWHDDEGPRVTVYELTIADDVVADASWVDWNSVASCIGMDVDELKGYGTDENVLARAQVYESVAAAYGFREFDSQPRELTLAEAEEEYGELVNRAHAAR